MRAHLSATWRTASTRCRALASSCRSPPAAASSRAWPLFFHGPPSRRGQIGRGRDVRRLGVQEAASTDPAAAQAELDERLMGLALAQAAAAAAAGDVPVGAVVAAAGGRVLGAAGNAVEASGDPTAHAELLAIRQAAAALASEAGGRPAWRALSTATLYVTLEPCAMCAGAALHSRLRCVVWGAPNPNAGGDGGWIQVLPPQRNPSGPSSTTTLEEEGRRPHGLHPELTVRRGVRGSECAAQLRAFFRRRRAEAAAAAAAAAGAGGGSRADCKGPAE